MMIIGRRAQYRPPRRSVSCTVRLLLCPLPVFIPFLLNYAPAVLIFSGQALHWYQVD